ncbi:ATP-binding protein [Emticicia oligotrophica]|uniref:ATP-binding protein n=1 Tax=Emticicia oligotrophica TaxID=312279 RepID=UPI00273B5C38|nr:ATP-binding protein [Emticicia oligotrophica]
MNTEQTLHQMRSLKLNGMAAAYQALLNLPYDQHPPTEQLLAQLVDAEILQRQHQRTVASIRAAKFRYQAVIEEIQYLPERNLDKNLMLRLTDTTFIKRAENVFITGATGCGKTGRPEPLYCICFRSTSLSDGTKSRVLLYDKTLAKVQYGKSRQLY